MKWKTRGCPRENGCLSFYKQRCLYPYEEIEKYGQFTTSMFDIGKHSSWMTDKLSWKNLGVCDSRLLCQTVFSTDSVNHSAAQNCWAVALNQCRRAPVVGRQPTRRYRASYRMADYMTNPYCGRMPLRLTYILWH